MPQKLNEFPCCGLHLKYFALIIDIKKCNKRKMNNILESLESNTYENSFAKNRKKGKLKKHKVGHKRDHSRNKNINGDSSSINQGKINYLEQKKKMRGKSK